MSKKLAITGVILLIVISLACQSFAQGAATGPLPATPGTALPGIAVDRLSYWELAGLGKKVSAVPVGGELFNPYSIFGPYGIHGQYSIYGPYGMYGPGGPGYGSGLGFNGFGMNDPWMLYKQYLEGKAQLAAAQAKAPAAKDASAKKPANATGPTNKTASAPANQTAPAQAGKTTAGAAD
ncbi:MAG: hypothetical protein A4E28_02118 [Methanocella sp. PtaU1.Bin125]|nr:MAG: hypothetical protein A4E28_02118 [Methanocella sp. PtaU1.Bin125]